MSKDSSTPPAEVPTDAFALLRFLRSTPTKQWPELRYQLAQRLGDPARADRLCDAAEREVAHEHKIALERAALRALLSEAITATNAALRSLLALQGDGVYDPEYAEDDDDLESFLQHAARYLRASHALNAVKQTSPVPDTQRPYEPALHTYTVPGLWLNHKPVVATVLNGDQSCADQPACDQEPERWAVTVRAPNPDVAELVAMRVAESFND